MGKTIWILCGFFFTTPLFAKTIEGGALPFSSRAAAGWGISHIEDTIVFFKRPMGSSAPRSLKTSIFDLNWVYTLARQGEEPYFIMTGRPCKNCDEAKALYAVRPSGSIDSFVYPGKIFEPQHRKLLAYYRVFFGKCLARKSEDVFLTFQEEQVDRKWRLQKSLLLVEPGQHFLKISLGSASSAPLKQTLAFVKKKECYELPGIQRLMSSKLVDIRMRADSSSVREEVSE